MNIDEITTLQRLNAVSNQEVIEIDDIKAKVWSRINSSENIIEVDSFSYLAVACAAAAIILLFFSVDILSSVQDTAAWALTETTVNVF